MKKLPLLIIITGLLLAAGLSGYQALQRTGSVRAEKPVDVAVSASGTPAASNPLHPATAASPRMAVSTNRTQPKASVQVVSSPGDRFQPIDEAQILDRRETSVSNDRKRRELLVKASGKYPFRRIEETLVKNAGAETYSILSRKEMVADHVLVKLQNGKTKDDLRAMMKRYSISILRELDLPGHYIVSLKAPTLDAVPEAISVFSRETELLVYVEPDYFSHITRVPNDSRWNDLWGMRKVNATGAWDVVTGSTNVTVAVIDTGIDRTHPDLISNLWVNAAEAGGIPGLDDDGNGYVDDVNGWDFGSGDNNPNDSDGHGTHCAGTIGAVGNNSAGVAGVCWSVRLMALRVVFANETVVSDLVNAIHYASDKKANIISASYGGGSYSETEFAALSYASSKGVLFVAAAGNDGANNDAIPFYPAGYDLPNIISVAASTDQSNDALASFSNYGKTSVDLAAPGVNILSTVPGGNYEFYQGTSMACPHVAGAAALLLSANPSFSYLQVKASLLNTVDKCSELAAKTVTGGRLNVKNMITLLDSDGDGMPDKWEQLYPTATVSGEDTDGDHLNNLDEYLNFCNPTNTDTDADSLADGWEVTYGFNPNSPTGGLMIASNLGRFNTAGDAKNIAVSGNYAYVADGASGLVILNIADPQSPVQVGSYDHLNPGIANDVAVSNGYAYVADGSNGLVIVNVANPAAPFLAGWKDTGSTGNAEGIAVQSNYVYLADGPNELVVLDVSNKASPILKGKTSTLLRSMHDVFVQGTSAYVAAYQNVFRISVANPAAPAANAAYGFTTWDMIGVHGNGTVVVAVAASNGVSILNANLSSKLGSYDTDGTASGVFVKGNFAYIADGTNGLVVLDITTPSAPTQIVHIATAGFASGVCVSGGYVYVAEGSLGIEIISILPDSDSDGMLDSWEMTWFSSLARNGAGDYDGDGISDRGEYLAELNPTRPDQDGDGLTDGLEACKVTGSTNAFYNTDPRLVDTDGDGLVDGYDGFVSTNSYLTGVDANHSGFVDGELNFFCSATNTDTDADGMNDGWEVRYGFNPNNISSPGPTNDVDSDGLTNLEESQNGTNPNNRDTDGDGMWDGWEVRYGLNPLVDDAAGDADGDGLTNLKEFELGTNPNNSDSDGDTMPDKWEYTYMPPLSPTNSLDGPLDPDLDGLSNSDEYKNECNPTNSDTDGDGLPDGWEVNYGLLPTSTNGVNGALGDPDGDKLLNIQEYNLCDSNLWLNVYTSVSGAPPTFAFMFVTVTTNDPPVTNISYRMPGSTNPKNADSDGDGLSDHYEITTNVYYVITTNASVVTTNAAGNLFITNPNNADTDYDGLPDKWEIDHYPASSPITPALPTDDSDGDGLTNEQEGALGTQRYNEFDPVFVDDDAPNDPGKQDPEYSDDLENGSMNHPFDSIQEAVNYTNTQNGMTVFITNGWYAFTGNYAIDTKGKAITIRSWNGPEDTTINSLGAGEVFRFTSGETTNTVIKGLSIKSNIGRCSDGTCDWVDIIYINNSSPLIVDCNISNGGQSGVKCVGSSRPWLVNCSISEVRNGIWCEGGAAPVIISNLIQDAYVTDGWSFDEDWGNGIYAVGASSMRIQSTTITSCEGRGIHIRYSGDLQVEDSVISGNLGGLWIKGTAAALVRTYIEDNEAPNYYKGPAGTVRAAWYKTPIDAEDVTFENENGGGILLTDGSQLRLDNAVIAGNRTWAQDPDYKETKLAPDYGLGGGIYVGTSCSVTGVNITVSENIAVTRGGGISSHEWSFFRNAIIWGNSAYNVYVRSKIGFYDPAPEWNEMHCRDGHITVWHGDLGYPYYSDPKIYVYGIIITNNPLFLGSGNYRLSGASPCIDIGSPANAPTNDIDGVLRPLDGNGDGSKLYDLGAYEYFYSTSLEDADRDGLSAAEEALLGTDPNNPDTDGDGFLDGFEVAHGFNPLVPENPAITDHDSDGLMDAQEIALGTDPANKVDPVWVDDDAAGDVAAGGEWDPDVSDPLANGSMENPFDSIQKAINTNTTVSGITILVKDGFYWGTGNYSIDTKGKAVKIRSENGPEFTIINSVSAGPVFNISQGGGTNTLIQGFSITPYGGLDAAVILSSNASVRIEQCWIFDSLSSGIKCLNGASPVISSCTVYSVNNGIYSTSGSGITIKDSSISNCTGRGIWLQTNTALQIVGTTIQGCGGGVRLDASYGLIERCEIASNTASDYPLINDPDENGAGILLLGGSSPRLINLLVTGNRTTATAAGSGAGGGIYVGAGSNPTNINCTIADNSAQYGGGIANYGNPNLRNMIIWNNSAVAATNASIFKGTNTLTITYSCVQGGYSPVIPVYVVITNNPLFVGNGNYRLASTNSPCYNKGTSSLAPTNDLDGDPRPVAGKFDMGCYEFFVFDGGGGGGGGGGGDLTDTDGDGMPDAWENLYNPPLNPTNSADGLLDFDGDGLTNKFEYIAGSNPTNSDTDADGMPDGWEYTYRPTLNPTNSLDALLDSDRDGLTNKFEYIAGCNPVNSDTDADGLPDGWEVRYTLSPTNVAGINGATGDPDGDTLPNLQEYNLGTNPRLADTDGDGLADNVEVSLGTLPANGRDPVYVDDNAPGDPGPGNPNISDTNENGSVAYPFDSIQEAIDINTTVSGMTIFVTNGLYEGTGNYDINPHGKNLRILSRNGSSNTTIKTHAYGSAFILNSGETANTVIQGFTIETYGDLAPEEGIVVDGSSPVIKNCVIHNCELEAVSCISNAAPQIINCRFYDVLSGLKANGSAGVLLQQSVVSNTTGRGIVIANDNLAQVTGSTIENCAGGITLNNSDASIRQCTIRNNEALNYYTVNNVQFAEPVQLNLTASNRVDKTSSDENGAGILILNGSSPLLENCLIVGNKTWADDPDYASKVSEPSFGLGAGIYVGSGCNPTGVNCTVANNHANTRGGGLSSAGRPVFRNMIFWGNTSSNALILAPLRFTSSGVDPNIHVKAEVINIWYSDIQYGHSNAVQSVTNNPLFVGGGDYHLASTNSPCYNGGDFYLAPTNDLDGNLRPTALPQKVDMGCYEGISSGGGGSTDTDSDGMPDAWENANGLNPLVNDAALDPDLDGLANLQEYTLGTRPQVTDTDGDAMPDGWEFSYMPPLNPTNSLDGLLDSDLDGLTNRFEYSNGCNPANPDTDADGLPDGWEVRYRLSPTNAAGSSGAAGDPDSDTLTNLQEYNLGTSPRLVDTDRDTMPDNWEMLHGLNPRVNDAAGDADNDGLTNLQEYTLGTDPQNSDTDGDGSSDGFEVAHGFNPLVAENPATTDHDSDGLTDAQEIALGTNPANGRDPVYVDDNAPGDPEFGNPEISRTNENGMVNSPFDSIQEAIDSSNTVNGMTILVTNGLYEGTGNYDITPRGKALRILSANGNANTFIITHAYGSAFIINSGETTNTVIQGFTIETYGDRQPEEGIVVSNASPVIKNCVIRNCELEAISCLTGAAPKIIGCWFYDVPNGLYADGSAGVLLQQSVVSDTSGRGIVILNDNRAEVTWSTIENCGGGIALDNSDTSIRQCIIFNNDALNYYTVNGFEVAAPVQFNLTASNRVDTTSSDENGAGILLLNGSSPLLQNCLIVGNRTWADDPDYSTKASEPSFGLGAGIYVGSGCNPTGINCTVANNHANTRGGGISSAGRPFFRNTIFWDNTRANAAIVIDTNGLPNRLSSISVDSIHLADDVINIWYSDIQGGYANAVLCIDANPQFVGGSDYRLASTNSPCYDSGTYYLAPLVDIDGNLRPTFDDYPVRVDMGCYQYGAPAATNPIALGAELALGAEADPLADTDGDGVSDRDEMAAGTDSYKESDYFRVYHEQSHTDGSVLIAWQSVVGSLYTVQSTDNLVSGVWSNVAGSTSLTGTGGVMSFSAQKTGSVRYYRVVVRRP